MAVPNVGQVIAAAFNKVVGDKPEDQIFSDRWLFDQFTTANGGLKKVDGGNQIEVPIQYATNTTFKSHSDMAALAIERVDVFDAAQYDWREHSGTITYSVLQQFKASGETAKFDLIAGLVDNAIQSHKNDLSSAMFGDGTGNGGLDINGLKNLIPDVPTTGITGGINAATFSFWRSKTATDGGSAYSTLRASMRDMYNNCSDGYSGQHPTTLVTDQTVFSGYEGLLIANERFTDKATGDGGFKGEALKFKGAKLAYDLSCPAETMYFLNPQAIKLYVAKGIFMNLGKELEPTNQHIRVRKVHTVAQFVRTQPRRLGVVISIA